MIDTETFLKLGYFFYRDKNHVYYHKSMVDGGTISIIKDADPFTFRNLHNSLYSMENVNCYYESAIIFGADRRSFKVDTDRDYAHDIKGRYHYGKRINH